MKHFLAIYTGTQEAREASGWDSLEASERERLEAKGRRAWHAWMELNSARLVVPGGPLGKTKLMSSNGVSDVVNSLCGYTIVEADDIGDAAALFTDHPHFSIFPGDGVEIIECLPIPGA